MHGAEVKTMAEAKKLSITDLITLRGLVDKISTAESVWSFMQAIEATEVAAITVVASATVVGVRKLCGRRRP